jgi:uncharacterized membrane protein YqgA involved in biofilm formation
MDDKSEPCGIKATCEYGFTVSTLTVEELAVLDSCVISAAASDIALNATMVAAVTIVLGIVIVILRVFL